MVPVVVQLLSAVANLIPIIVNVLSDNVEIQKPDLLEVSLGVIKLIGFETYL